MSDTLRNALAECKAAMEAAMPFCMADAMKALDPAIETAHAALAALPEQRPQAHDGTLQKYMAQEVAKGMEQLYDAFGAVKQGAPAAPADLKFPPTRVLASMVDHGRRIELRGWYEEDLAGLRAALASIPNTEAGDRMSSVHPAQATERGKAP